MQSLDKKLFKYSRTHSALTKMNAARDKFLVAASQDRYAVVGLALMDFAADLLEKIGYAPVAVEMRGRAAQLKREAEQAILLNKRSKRAQIAVGARPAQVEQVVNGMKTVSVPIPQTANVQQNAQPNGQPAVRTKRKYTRRQPVQTSHPQASQQPRQARAKRNVEEPVI